MSLQGVFVSDLHLSYTSPSARKDWIPAQIKMLKKLRSVCRKNHCPLFIAGDIFHKSKEDPIAVSLMLKYLKGIKIYAIPGQHDLPGHSLKRIEESSFWNLIESGLVRYVYETPVRVKNMVVYGQPYNTPIPKCSEEKNLELIYVLIGHRMCWQKKPFPGAPKSGNVKQIRQEYGNFDFIVFGDNHQGFVSKKEYPIVINCGCAIRRTRTELEYKPRCWGITDNQEVVPITLPYKDDLFEEKQKEDTREKDTFSTFIEIASKYTEVSLSFKNNIKQFLEKTHIEDDIKNIIWEVIEEIDNGLT